MLVQTPSLLSHVIRVPGGPLGAGASYFTSLGRVLWSGTRDGGDLHRGAGEAINSTRDWTESSELGAWHTVGAHQTSWGNPTEPRGPPVHPQGARRLPSQGCRERPLHREALVLGRCQRSWESPRGVGERGGAESHAGFAVPVHGPAASRQGCFLHEGLSSARVRSVVTGPR